MKTSLAKNAVYKALLNIFNLVIPAFITPYLLNIPINTQDFEMYNRTYTEFSTFFILAAFGIYTFGMREISRVRGDQQKVNRLFTSLFIIGSISNFITIVIYIIFSFQRSTGNDIYIYLIFIIQFVSNVFYIEFINEAIENYGFITKKTILVRLIYFISILLFVRSPDDIQIYAAIISLTVLLNNLISYVYLKKNIQFDFHNLQIMKYMVPLTIALILTNIDILYMQLDKLLLGFWVDDNAVTQYATTYNIIGMLCTLPLSLITVAIPRVSHLISHGKEKEYQVTLKTTIESYMAILIPMCFGVSVLATEILDIYTNGRYVDSAFLLIIMSLSRIVIGYESILNNMVLYVNGLEKQMTIFLVIFGIINAVFDIVLYALHIFNPITAILSTTLVITILNISMYFYTKRILPFSYQLLTLKTLKYILICCLFFPIKYILFLFPLPYILNIILVIIVCTSVYGFYLLISKDYFLFLLIDKLQLTSYVKKIIK